jgi:putative endonuclease
MNSLFFLYHMFTTYILYSKELEKFYIGSTSGDIGERLKKHLSNHKGFTARAKDWELVYSEKFATKTESLRRERQLKSWKSNIRIKEFIARSSSE